MHQQESTFTCPVLHLVQIKEKTRGEDSTFQRDEREGGENRETREVEQGRERDGRKREKRGETSEGRSSEGGMKGGGERGRGCV